ncbi:choline-sulfatase [Cobetia marina]|uniref:Choline-sulfatase n=1 Tax=Cobetia marina TaxID=28258 RepID=A0ABU9GKQ4_COBMA
MSDKPNIILLMADQVSALALPSYGNDRVKAPNIKLLGESSFVFDKAYCNYPLCAPSRYALLTGKLCSNIGAYDNASEFKSSTPTFVHSLRKQGYQSTLIGKMHFIGSDQLHGYEERLTTEIYPSDFSWVPDWEGQGEKLAFQDMTNVVSAAPSSRTLQLDYDEQVGFKAEQKIYDLARSEENRPFFLTVSFTHPHDPYSPPKKYWDLYSAEDIEAPKVPFISYEERDPHSQDLYTHYGMHKRRPTEQETMNARLGYYASISYIDEKIGRIVEILKETGQWDNSIIIFTSDHGDMMGERGMWYKKTFYEWSLRVPLMIRMPIDIYPDLVDPCHISQPVSHIDIFPTVQEMIGSDISETQLLDLDGVSLTPYFYGKEPDQLPFPRAEYLAEGTTYPQVSLIHDGYKLITTGKSSYCLFDLNNDPDEIVDLSNNNEYKAVFDDLMILLARQWDLDALRIDIVKSQKYRNFVSEALNAGKASPWDFTPIEDASKQFVRSGKWCANAEVKAHLPYRGDTTSLDSDTMVGEL